MRTRFAGFRLSYFVRRAALCRFGLWRSRIVESMVSICCHETRS